MARLPFYVILIKGMLCLVGIYCTANIKIKVKFIFGHLSVCFWGKFGREDTHRDLGCGPQLFAYPRSLFYFIYFPIKYKIIHLTQIETITHSPLSIYGDFYFIIALYKVKAQRKARSLFTLAHTQYDAG